MIKNMICYFGTCLLVALGFTFFAHEASTEFETVFAYIATLGYVGIVAPFAIAGYQVYKGK